VAYLLNCWYQAAWAEELREGGVVSRTIADVPLLFWRDCSGAPSALLDRCPHRFAPLSAGTVSSGRVTCGYHGLAFDRAGRCVHNPHGGITTAMNATSFPVIERHTAVWVWLGNPEKADPARVPDLSFIDSVPEIARIAGYLPTKANYELMTDNILDLSHADYLHPTSLGGMMSSAVTNGRIDGDDVLVEWDARNCVPPGAFQLVIPPPARGDIWIQVRWSAPAVMTLTTFAAEAGTPRSEDKTAMTLHNMTPATVKSTHYFYCNTRRFLQEDAAFSDRLRTALSNAFSQEDKPMLEKQQMRIGDADFWALEPILLSLDTAAVRARRKPQQLIAAESGG